MRVSSWIQQTMSYDVFFFFQVLHPSSPHLWFLQLFIHINSSWSKYWIWMNHIFSTQVILSSTEMCAHFAPDFRFLPPSPSPEDRAPDPPGFQIFRREVEVGGSPDGPRAAEASGNLLRCWSHGPVEIVDEKPFLLLMVDLSRKVFVYQRPHHMNPREFEHHLEIGDAGCVSLTTKRDELVIQPVGIAWNDMNRQQPQCNRDSTSKKMRCWRIRWPQTSTKHIPSGYVEIAIEHGP